MLGFVLGVGSGIGLTTMLIPDLDEGNQRNPQATRPVAPSEDKALVRSLQGALSAVESTLKNEVEKSAALDEELAQLKGRLAVELAENEERLNARMAKDAEAVSKSPSRTDRNADSKRFKRVTNLRPDQATALESLMEQYNANQIALREARANGTVPPPEINLDQLLSSILDDEQVAAVEDYHSEIRQGRDETRATARMNRIAPSLGLNEEQKDAVFGVYYTSISNNTEIAASNETLASQMRQILTPEQFKDWQELNAE